MSTKLPSLPLCCILTFSHLLRACLLNFQVILQALLTHRYRDHIFDPFCDPFPRPSPHDVFLCSPQVIVQALLATADREDAADTHLQASAYETMNEVVRSSTDDTVQVVVQLIPVIMTKLGATLQMQILSGDDKERQSELQALLCGVLQVRRRSGG